MYIDLHNNTPIANLQNLDDRYLYTAPMLSKHFCKQIVEGEINRIIKHEYSDYIFQPINYIQYNKNIIFDYKQYSNKKQHKIFVNQFIINFINDLIFACRNSDKILNNNNIYLFLFHELIYAHNCDNVNYDILHEFLNKDKVKVSLIVSLNHYRYNTKAYKDIKNSIFEIADKRVSDYLSKTISSKYDKYQKYFANFIDINYKYNTELSKLFDFINYDLQTNYKLSLKFRKYKMYKEYIKPYIIIEFPLGVDKILSFIKYRYDKFGLYNL